jgi:hypothetical protein
MKTIRQHRPRLADSQPPVERGTSPNVPRWRPSLRVLRAAANRRPPTSHRLNRGEKTASPGINGSTRGL